MPNLLQPIVSKGNKMSKGKILYSFWLTSSEKLSLKESLKVLQNENATSKELGYALSNITDIIQTTYERGDFKI